MNQRTSDNSATSNNWIRPLKMKVMMCKLTGMGKTEGPKTEVRCRMWNTFQDVFYGVNSLQKDIEWKYKVDWFKNLILRKIMKTYLINHDISKGVVFVIVTTLILIVISAMTIVYVVFATRFDVQSRINNGFPICWVSMSATSKASAVAIIVL